MARNDHPAWRAYLNNQYVYPSEAYSSTRDSEVDSAYLDALGSYTHNLGMVKDLLIVIMNLLEEHKQLLDEHADLLDLVLANTMPDVD